MEKLGRGFGKGYNHNQSFQHQDRDYHHYERKEGNARERQHRDFSAALQRSNLSNESDFGKARPGFGKDNQGNHLHGFYVQGDR